MTRKFHLSCSLLWCVALLAGCLDVAEDRAERDLQIGVAELGDVQFQVRDGLALVRHLSDGDLRLWSSAPLFELEVTATAGATRAWTIQVHNCMPDAELVIVEAPADAVIERQETLLGTRKEWRVVLPEGNTVLRVAPPDHRSTEPFRFALLSDVQEAIDGLIDIHRAINQDPLVKFLVGAGDLTQRGTREQLERYQRELEALNVPYYTTLGNHELGESPTLWHEFFGRASFRFVYREVQFSLLDSGSATLDPLVHEWVDAWLEEGKNRVHVVGMHIPPLDPIGVRNGAFASRNEALALLLRLARGRVDLTLYGHIHSHYSFENAGIRAEISGGGGAIPERLDGIGRHFMVIDVDPLQTIQSARVVRID